MQSNAPEQRIYEICPYVLGRDGIVDSADDDGGEGEYLPTSSSLFQSKR